MNTATAIVHEDVRGKKLHYLKVSNGSSDVLINIGEKTYQSVKDLDKQLDLPLPKTEEDAKPKPAAAKVGNTNKKR